MVCDSLFCEVILQATASDIALCYDPCDPRHTLALAKGTAVALLFLCPDQFYHVINVLGQGVTTDSSVHIQKFPSCVSYT